MVKFKKRYTKTKGRTTKSTRKKKYYVLEMEGGIYGSFKTRAAANRRRDKLNKSSSSEFYVYDPRPFGSRKSEQRHR